VVYGDTGDFLVLVYIPIQVGGRTPAYPRANQGQSQKKKGLPPKLQGLPLV